MTMSTPAAGPTMAPAIGRELLDPEGLAADEAVARSTSFFGKVYAAWWSLLCSLPRAMYLLLLLGVACFVGMFFDQTLTYEEHAAQWARYGQISVAGFKLSAAEVLTFFEMNDVFGSWWFVGIVAYLLISITSCSIERFPKIWLDALHPKKHLSDDQLRGIKQTYRTTIDAKDAARAQGLFKRIFGSRVDEHVADGANYMFFERHRFARFGVYIIHAGLFLIFTGGILVNMTKIDGMMMITEGRSGRWVRVWGPGRLPSTHDLGFEVRCEDFRLKTFVDGAPMEFESDLSVWDKNSPVNPVLKKTIQVNDPLEYGGYTFYQASYNPIPGDQRAQLEIGPRGGERRVWTVSIGDRIPTGDGTVFVPIEIIPDFAGLGPAVRVQQFTAEGKETSFVVFRQYPEFDREVRRGSYDVQFRGFDQQYATGIQVGRVPFIPWVFAGFLTMFVGMFMAFFMSHRRYWGRLLPSTARPGALELVVAGAARRHQYAFDEEFGRIRELLTLAFGAGESTADRARALREARKRAETEGADEGQNS